MNESITAAINKIIALNPTARFTGAVPYITTNTDGFSGETNKFYWGNLIGDNFGANLEALIPDSVEPLDGSVYVLLENSATSGSGYFIYNGNLLLKEVTESGHGFYFQGYELSFAGI